MAEKFLQRLDIITLFPAMFEGPLTESLIGRARERGVVRVVLHALRDYSQDIRHHKVDDRPFGGGAGMVLQAEPFVRALQKIKKDGKKELKGRLAPHVVLMSPQGQTFSQAKAQSLSQFPWLVVLCGHYEGVDERVMRWVDEEISIGDYVLTGGELPAMVLADTVLRLVPGVVKEADSIRHDSFQNGLLDHPQYTRPALWRGRRVPSILLSGDHQAIRQWRARQALSATLRKRPDLASDLTPSARRLV